MRPSFQIRGAPQVDPRHLRHQVRADCVGRWVADFALREKLPAGSMFPEFAQSGGLFAYGPSFAALVRRSPRYIDRIFRGAKPGDLPVEQPIEFELVINLKTAKALG